VSLGLELLWVPFLACLVLAGIHVYLGLHVLARGVIFVDLALAQVAALGMTAALLAGHAPQSDAAYAWALAFTAAGAALLALSGDRPAARRSVPQEAVIGIVYAVAAAFTVLVLDRVPQGSEHIKQLLVGSILTVTVDDVARLAALYAALGALHWLVRRPLLALSFGGGVRHAAWWDFLFYLSFGWVVTSSVRIAGVLLVFAYLIVPAVVGAWLAQGVPARLVIGWAVGVAVSVLALAASWTWDLPTGAAIVATFGVVLALVGAGRGALDFARRLRADGPRAAGAALVLAGALPLLAGLVLAAFPRADHVWLDGVERLVPAVQLAFLTPHERGVWRDSHRDIERGLAQLAELRALQADVQWGRRDLPGEERERLRQFLTGRDEIVAGDRLVLRTLRGHARQRQRFALGVPLAAGGLAVVAAGLYLRRRSRAAGATSPPAPPLPR
jgi:zinc/manganese transport system permease protein